MTSTSTTTATLRDGYTKRAADVLREIDDGRARLPGRGPASWSRHLGIGAAVVAVAVGAGVLVARSSGDRLAGEEITGGAPSGDIASLLAEARLLRVVDPIAATQLYGEVLDARPDHPEALTYSAWLLLAIGEGSSDEAVTASAVEERATSWPKPLTSIRRMPTRTASSPSWPPTSMPTSSWPEPRPARASNSIPLPTCGRPPRSSSPSSTDGGRRRPIRAMAAVRQRRGRIAARRRRRPAHFVAVENPQRGLAPIAWRGHFHATSNERLDEFGNDVTMAAEHGPIRGLTGSCEGCLEW